jgi:predicted alpha/beta-fold hydrolase
MINSNYRAPLLFRNGHIHTVYPALFRRVDDVYYQRERIETLDNDFLDLDWSRVGGETLVILSHGLEGDSHRPYVKGMVRALNRHGIDALAWNYRGCSGEPNRQLRMYHNGAIDDLHAVVAHAAPAYRSVYLVGFSMGGNLTLLYLGKMAAQVPAAVQGSVTFSVPCDLADSAAALERRRNTIYMARFLNSLHDKIRAKQARFPEALDDQGYHEIKTFRAFDGRYTAPLHGFDSAEDYWRKCSCGPWLEQIRLPSLIVNAFDDPFLTKGCYPIQMCASNPHTTLEITRHGGHVGFVPLNNSGCYWSEERAVAFIRQLDSRQQR